MKLLVIGSGGREDALVWALARSPRVTTLRCAPGNAGSAGRAEIVDIEAGDIDALVDHCAEQRYDLVIVGPEGPLVAGLADRLRELGIPVFGPSAAAAELEGSKIFSKLFMARHGIPTAEFEVFGEIAEARRYLESDERSYPLVVKADGLAAGKGVIIAEDRSTAVAAAEGMLSGRSFGDAGSRIVVEEMLRGREASFFVVSDGRNFIELATCQDYKRALDGDGGLNTGGMGCYSPSAFLDEPLRLTIVSSIVQPTIRGLLAEERPYVGVLYVGVMLTVDGPKVLEYNVRFGDPETQVLMPRLDEDWLPVLHASATGGLEKRALRWKDDAAVCVVMAAGGYPGSYDKGMAIEGVDRAEADDAVVVFHAGTRREPDGPLQTSGGRVLGVTALGSSLDSARRSAYEAVGRIHWAKEHHRSDIALEAVETLERAGTEESS